MPDPRWDSKRGDPGKGLLKKRQLGGSPGEDSRKMAVENYRREPDLQGEIKAALPITQSTPTGSPDVAPAPPAQKPGPDRHHKESGNIYGAYVILAPDHGSEDPDTPTNAGYRTDNVPASSLNDAYTKALALAAGFHGKEGSRVCIQIKGGQWLEDLNCHSDAIDLQGVGRPRIYGHVTVSPGATRFRATNIEFRSADDREAVRVHPSPFMPLGVSPIKFLDCWFHGVKRGFWSERKVLLYGCEGWQDLDNSATEEAAFTFSSAVDDNDFSLAIHCNLRSYNGLNASLPGVLPPGVRTPSGFAVRATGKTGFGYLMPLLDTNLGLLRPMSGLEMRYCTIEGSLVCEGWVVMHKHCQCYSGIVSLTVNGGVYARIRGWLFSPKLLNGIVQFDHSTVHAGHIAEFYADASQTNPNICGGLVHFRHSAHLSGIGGVAATTCANFGGTALFYHDRMSSTASQHWLGGGGTSTPDDTTGCGTSPTEMVDVMFDPHQL